MFFYLHLHSVDTRGLATASVIFKRMLAFSHPYHFCWNQKNHFGWTTNNNHLGIFEHKEVARCLGVYWTYGWGKAMELSSELNRAAVFWFLLTHWWALRAVRWIVMNKKMFSSHVLCEISCLGWFRCWWICFRMVWHHHQDKLSCLAEHYWGVQPHLLSHIEHVGRHAWSGRNDSTLVKDNLVSKKNLPFPAKL